MRGRVEAKAIAAHHGLSGLRDVFFGDASRVLGRFHDQRAVGVQVGRLPVAGFHDGRDKLEVGFATRDDVRALVGDDGQRVVPPLGPDAEAVVGGVVARRRHQQVARGGEDPQAGVHDRAVADAPADAGGIDRVGIKRAGLGREGAGPARVATVEVATGDEKQKTQCQCGERRCGYLSMGHGETSLRNMATLGFNSRLAVRRVPSLDTSRIGRPGHGKRVIRAERSVPPAGDVCLPMFPGGPAFLRPDGSPEDRWLCVLTFQ
jgi:hypothetical protein